MQTCTAASLTPFVSESYDDAKRKQRGLMVIDEKRTTTENDDQTDDIALHKDTLEDLEATDSDADVMGGRGTDSGNYCQQTGASAGTGDGT